MSEVSRRRFVLSAPALVGGALFSSACSQGSATETYEAAVARTWREGAESTTKGDGRADVQVELRADEQGTSSGQTLGRELIRMATLAPSSHNTQCWKFSLEAKVITILPDRARRCPAVDPDDHHMYVSLGCATENLVHAALAQGLQAEARFDASHDAINAQLSPVAARSSPLFKAITSRQCTRADYDGKSLSAEELVLLEKAGTSDAVRVLMLTERQVIEQLLEYVIQGNTAQIADPAFVKELLEWIRFNEADAVRSADGLFSLVSDSPVIPAWLGKLAFDWFFTAKGENDKIARQIRSSAGVAVFVGQSADKAHWVEVGRCYQRFALQATALGIRNAFLNQPVEVATVRSPFAAALGLGERRPDLVVRFGRGPIMPRSLRRPVEAVMV